MIHDKIIVAFNVNLFLAQEVDGRTFVTLPADRGSLSRMLKCEVSAGAHNKLQPLFNQAKSEQQLYLCLVVVSECVLIFFL